MSTPEDEAAAAQLKQIHQYFAANTNSKCFDLLQNMFSGVVATGLGDCKIIASRPSLPGTKIGGLCFVVAMTMTESDMARFMSMVKGFMHDLGTSEGCQMVEETRVDRLSKGDDA